MSLHYLFRIRAIISHIYEVQAKQAVQNRINKLNL